MTPYYPGLEGATSALMSMTGLSSYAAGVILVGAARLVLVASLFLLFQRVSGSARVAGLGVAIYAGNFNFLYWGAQFSYESLALPLLLLAMMALAEREVAPKEALRSWAGPVVLAMMAIVVTHHLSSYAVAVFLVGLSLAYWYVHRRWRPAQPLAAGDLRNRPRGCLAGRRRQLHGRLPDPGPQRRVRGDRQHDRRRRPAARALPGQQFQRRRRRRWERGRWRCWRWRCWLPGLPFGLRALWRRYRREPFALLFGLAAIAFFATLVLRLVPPAWETGNRLSEFLFVGLAFVLALRRGRGAGALAGPDAGRDRCSRRESPWSWSAARSPAGPGTRSWRGR